MLRKVRNYHVAAGEGTIANEEATKRSRMAKLTKVMTTSGTFSRRNIQPPRISFTIQVTVSKPKCFGRLATQLWKTPWIGRRLSSP